MVKRQLRVGDLVDDYCPRERRLTDHAVVAMVEDDVRQVRCTACDAEHEYREAKVPATRKKKPLVAPPPLPPAAIVAPPEDAKPAAPPEPAEPAAAPAAIEQAAAPAEPGPETPRPAEGPVHRQLIRATLPRVEGQVPERRIPEFTMHNTGGRGAGPHGKSFRSGGHAGHGGHRMGGGKGQPGQGKAGGARHGHSGGGFSQPGGKPGQSGPGASGGRPARHAFGGRPGRGKKQ